ASAARPARHVHARDANGREVRRDHATLQVRPTEAGSLPHVERCLARPNRDPAVALLLRVVPLAAPASRRSELTRGLVRGIEPHLLQAQDVGPTPREPRAESPPHAGTEPVDVQRGERPDVLHLYGTDAT